tara:strand:- start:96 stop:500 length:405 start_codon:yes stop_codon:yes gene_type:complete
MNQATTLTLYTDGESYIYKPEGLEGFLLLNYEDITRNIFYKFIYGKVDSGFTKIKEDKQKALSLYNMFYNYIDNEQDIEVYNLAEHDDENSDFEEDDEEDVLLEHNPLEEAFGYTYNTEEDNYSVHSLVEFNIM